MGQTGCVTWEAAGQIHWRKEVTLLCSAGSKRGHRTVLPNVSHTHSLLGEYPEPAHPGLLRVTPRRDGR